MGAVAETLIRQVPEVTQVGRRTGRAELDEHAEGVHSAEIDVDLRRDGERDREPSWPTSASGSRRCRRRWPSASPSATGWTTCCRACARRSR
jgi:Cu/Ag efflux pump CusA